MNLRDTLERLWWTLLAAFLGALGVGDLLDISTLDAAVTAAAAAGVNFLLIVARARLAVLPDPGAGLPGLPSRAPTAGGTDAGQANVSGAVWLIVGVLLIVVLLRLLGWV